MLEQAEVAIRSAETLGLVDILMREDRDTAELKKVLETIRAHWTPDMLPKNLKELADNIHGVIRELRIDAERLKVIIETSIATSGVSVDQGPYQSILLWLVRAEEEKVRNFIRRDNSRMRLVLYEVLDFPTWMRPPAAKNVIYVTGR